MPIYRLQEGSENLGKNKDTFERCHAIFRKGGAVLMFSEGLCIQEMRLRPLKKGTARIALEYSKDGSPLTIIPTGFNYMKPMQFREDVMISMDTPFNAADFAAEFNENNSKGIQSFNKRLLTGLQNSVIDIRDRQNEKEIGQLVEIEYNNGTDLTRLVNTVKQLNEFPQPELISSLGDYKAVLEKNKLDDDTVAGKSGSMWWLLPALAIFSITFWLYVLPIGLAVTLVNKKVRLPEFKDSVLIGVSVNFVFFYWLIIFGIVASTLGIIVGVQVILVFMLVASLTGPAYDMLSRIRQTRIFNAIPDKESIQRQRKRVSDLVLNLVKPHQSHHPVG
jgi:hypothetical protein